MADSGKTRRAMKKRAEEIISREGDSFKRFLRGNPFCFRLNQPVVLNGLDTSLKEALFSFIGGETFCFSDDLALYMKGISCFLFACVSSEHEANGSRFIFTLDECFRYFDDINRMFEEYEKYCFAKDSKDMKNIRKRANAKANKGTDNETKSVMRSKYKDNKRFGTW